MGFALYYGLAGSLNPGTFCLVKIWGAITALWLVTVTMAL